MRHNMSTTSVNTNMMLGGEEEEEADEQNGNANQHIPDGRGILIMLFLSYFFPMVYLIYKISYFYETTNFTWFDNASIVTLSLS